MLKGSYIKRFKVKVLCLLILEEIDVREESREQVKEVRSKPS